MNNYKQPGDTLTVEAPYALSSGDGAQVGDAIFGVAVNDAESGDSVELKTEGVFELVKDAGTAWTAGDLVYWDDSAKECDVDSSAGILVGYAVEDVGSSAVLGKVKLCGRASGTLIAPQTAEADLTFGTNITAATANGALTDSSATNPTDAQFNELAKELGVKINNILAKLRLAGIIAP